MFHVFGQVVGDERDGTKREKGHGGFGPVGATDEHSDAVPADATAATCGEQFPMFRKLNFSPLI